MGDVRIVADYGIRDDKFAHHVHEVIEFGGLDANGIIRLNPGRGRRDSTRCIRAEIFMWRRATLCLRSR